MLAEVGIAERVGAANVPSREQILSADIRSLVRRSHPLDSKERFLFMLDTRVYCDESYNDRIYTVTGYLAQGDEWIRLTEEWAKALEDEQVPFAKNSAYRVFHANEVAGGYGVFSALTPDDRARIQKRFATIISEANIYGFASAIVLEHYRAFQERIKAARGSVGDPYFLAFQHAIEMACQLIEKVDRHERIAFIFDRNKQLGVKEGGRAHQLYDSLLRDTKNLDYLHRLGGITFEDKARILPLQTADYGAYEHFKYLNEVKYGDRSERWQWGILKNSFHYGRVFDKPEMEAFMKAVGW